MSDNLKFQVPVFPPAHTIIFVILPPSYGGTVPEKRFDVVFHIVK
jgi:hypothetical protein